MKVHNGRDAVVDVGRNLFVSHKDVCDTRASEFDRILHIWRDDHPGYSCEAVVAGNAPGMTLDYKDGTSLTEANHTILEIAEFLSGEDKVLVHCAVGQTRSPTIALIGKVARGDGLWPSIADIFGASWEGREIAWNFCLTPMKEIFKWAESR